MDNKIDIKVYTKFKNDLKIKDNIIDLFYYYLDNDAAGTNDGIDDFAGKTDIQLDEDDRFEAKVSSGQGKLHILSTDIIDDVTLVSKLVDPYILSDGYKYIYVMYRLKTTNELAKYYYAFRVELKSQSSEITANDYNYLYFDLTEFGSVLAKIRLNNTSPIYKTSHSVSSDGKHNGSGVQGSLIGPNSDSEFNDLEDDSLSQVPNITVKNAFRDDRTYTEEFYHMGDFTIRLLGKTLPPARIEQGKNTYDSNFDLNDFNLMTVRNPTEPESRTLKYLSFDDLRNAFVPRIASRNNSLLEVNTANYQNKFIKLISSTTSKNDNVGISFKLSYGDEIQATKVSVKPGSNPNSYELDYLNSYSYGDIGDLETWIYTTSVGQASREILIEVWIKIPNDASRKLYLVDIYREVPSADVYPINLFTNDSSNIRDSLASSEKLASYAITTNPEINSSDLYNNTGDGGERSIDFTCMEVRGNLIEKYKYILNLAKVHNNIKEFENGIEKFNDSNDDYFDKDKCIALHCYNETTTTSGSNKKIISDGTEKNVSNVLNVVINTTISNITVKIKLGSFEKEVILPGKSVFVFKNQNNSGFIKTSVNNSVSISPMSGDTVTTIKYSQNDVEYVTDNSATATYSLDVNENTTLHLINESNVAKTVTIVPWQHRKLVINGGVSNINYGVPGTNLQVSLPPHSMNVINCTHTDTRLLYQIPIYYT